MAAVSEGLIPHEIIEKLGPSGGTLLILPAGDLSSVPFAALPLRDGRNLIDIATPIVLPSVDALFFWVKAPVTWKASVIVGDPDLSKDKDWDFIPLPGARREAEQVAAMLGGRALTGASATYDAVRGSFSGTHPSLIYFATHGISDSVNPMDGSFLALNEQHLRGAQIKQFSFPSVHPLVVMSACQSGLGKAFQGGVFGLARAWIFAGASQVLASQWNVDDDATADFMLAFMGDLSRGASSAEAYRLAVLQTRQIHKDPALWGSFNFFGYPQPITERR